MSVPRAVVVGQLARDIVLYVERMPEVGTAVDVRLRRELLGGKGANQAVAMAQLGVAVALVAVAGDDEVADRLLAQARRDGIDVAPVIRRPGAETALIVELLEPGGRWRYLQHLPEEVQLAESDVDAAGDVLASADAWSCSFNSLRQRRWRPHVVRTRPAGSSSSTASPPTTVSAPRCWPPPTWFAPTPTRQIC